MTDSPISTLPEEMLTKWETFIAGLNALVEETFTNEENPGIVVGAQWGEMGGGNGLPAVVVTSNIPVCITPDAIHDMLLYAEQAHNRYHGGEGDSPMEPMTAEEIEALPEEVLAEARTIAEQFGLDVTQIGFVKAVDLADLDDPASALNIPEVRDPEQRFESGSENEG